MQKQAKAAVRGPGKSKTTINQICTNCEKNQSNPGKSWCQSCYLDQMNKQVNLNEFIKEGKRIKKNIKLEKYNQGKNPKNIPSILRHEAWKKYISDILINGKCFCCQSNEINISNFECGHVISRKNGGPVTLENLRPICSQCNKSMGTNDMDEFISSCGLWNKDIESEENVDKKYSFARLNKDHLQRILTILNLDQNGSRNMIHARIAKNKDKLQKLSLKNLNMIASLVFTDKVRVSSDNRTEIVNLISSKFLCNFDRTFGIEEYKIILLALGIKTNGKHDDLASRILENMDGIRKMEYKQLQKLGIDLVLEESDDKDQIVNQIIKMIKYSPGKNSESPKPKNLSIPDETDVDIDFRLELEDSHHIDQKNQESETNTTQRIHDEYINQKTQESEMNTIQCIQASQAYQSIQGSLHPQTYQGYQGFQGYLYPQAYQGYQGYQGFQAYQAPQYYHGTTY